MRFKQRATFGFLLAMLLSGGALCLPPAYRAWSMALSLGNILLLGNLLRLIYAENDRGARAETQARTLNEALQGQVTEQVQATLEERERFLRVIQGSNDGFWEWEFSTGLVYWSERSYELAGISPELREITYTVFEQALHAADREHVKREVTESIEKGAPFTSEFRFVHASSRVVNCFSRGRVYFDAQGKPVRMAGMMTDITEERLMRKALAESEARFRNLADQAPLMIFLTDAERQNIYVNKSWGAFTGLTLEQSRNRGWMQLVHPEDLSMVTESFNRSLREKATFETLFRMRRTDGEYCWIHTRLVARYEAEGSFSGYVGACIDVTEQKRIEEQLEAKVRERTFELQKSNQLLHSVVENVPGMIFLKNARDLRFELFNKAGAQITGFTETELIGKNDYDFFPPEQADFFVGKDRETLNSGRLSDIPEEPLLTRSGETRILHTKKVPIVDEDGQPIYLLGISQDITEARDAQARIEALNEQLQEQIRNLNAVNQELEAFSYSVSHDLRTPLRIIDGFAQAVLDDYGPRLDDTGRRYMQRVQEGSQQMAQLIDDMLCLFRLTRNELKKEPVDLSAMTAALLCDLQLHDPRPCVAFEIQPGLMVDTDRRLMQAVLQNLTDNAWKFTIHQAAPCIEFGQTEQAGQRVYFFRDNGAGFEMAYADKLFGLFQRLHEPAEFPGTGIGLATVQRVIHRLGGEVWAEGQLGRGAVFYFTLP